jgi:hypothetical protein
MTNLIHTNTIEWKDYKTEFYTEKKLKEFLLKESIPCLSCRFKEPQEFYESLIFKIPEGKNHKNYKMIYSHLIKNPEKNLLNKSELEKKYSINKQNILIEGSVTPHDISSKNKPTIKWIIIKV